MSTVKVTNLQHPSSGSANIELGSDGSVVLPAGFTGGLGTNVAQTVKADTFSTASTSYTPVTGLTVNFTPSSNTVKVLVIAVVPTSFDDAAVSTAHEGGGRLGLFRASTNLTVPTSPGNRLGGIGSTGISGSTSFLNPLVMVFLDDPQTASQVTYSVQANTITAAQTLYVNRSVADSDVASRARAVATLTAIEVAA